MKKPRSAGITAWVLVPLAALAASPALADPPTPPPPSASTPAAAGVTCRRPSLASTNLLPWTVDAQGHIVPNPLFASVLPSAPPASGNGSATPPAGTPPRPAVDPADAARDPATQPGQSGQANGSTPPAGTRPAGLPQVRRLGPLEPLPPAPVAPLPANWNSPHWERNPDSPGAVFRF